MLIHTLYLLCENCKASLDQVCILPDGDRDSLDTVDLKPEGWQVSVGAPVLCPECIPDELPYIDEGEE